MTDSYQVETTSGRLRGTAQPDGRVLFAATPFAEPPIGPLRLRPPQPPRSWTGVREATQFAPSPAQRSSALRSGKEIPVPPMLAAIFPTGGDHSEDSLYLNVSTPELGGRRPGIV